MTNNSNSPSSRFAIWLPSCQLAEAATLERFCLDMVNNSNGQVVAVFHNDKDRLLATLQAGEIDTILYPHYGPVVRDSLLSGIAHGVFLGLFRVTLRCASDHDFLAVPHAFVHLAQDVMVNHLQAFYDQSSLPVGDAVPLGYRRVGNMIEIDPDQAEQVRDAFRSKATER